MEFKVTLHEQVRYRGTLQYWKLQSVTQLDTMVKSTMTETCSAILRSRRNCSSDGADGKPDGYSEYGSSSWCRWQSVNVRLVSVGVLLVWTIIDDPLHTTRTHTPHASPAGRPSISHLSIPPTQLRPPTAPPSYWSLAVSHWNLGHWRWLSRVPSIFCARIIGMCVIGGERERSFTPLLLGCQEGHYMCVLGLWE